jgi:phosphohistidine phosphatase
MGVIQRLPEDYETVMLFGHNPTFTSVANLFSSTYIDNMPTCGIARIDADVSNWMEFKEDNAKLVEFHYPKQYF